MVYVISMNGEPLMPTGNGKARILLKEKKAVVKRRKPFTIGLTYEPETSYTQPITLGIDSGYSTVGFSAVTDKKELLAGEFELLKNMKDRLEAKARYRRVRRSRLRYRAPRFDNRKRTKPTGWLAPSLKHKLDSHMKFIASLYAILPITSCVVEVANFDIQKMKDDTIRGVDYQQGDMLGFWNVREYVLHRDQHRCQNPDCRNRGSEVILKVHHIRYRSNGGTDAPGNLITLCSRCHTPANHQKGRFLYTWMEEGKKTRGYRDATFMTTIRWKLIEQLRQAIRGVRFSYGYQTKNHRIRYEIEKSHCNDAFAIAGGVEQIRNPVIHRLMQSRRNNRSLEMFYDAQYIDTRTGEKASGTVLNSGRTTRNHNHDDENQRVYRGQKLSKGQRRIRAKRHFYQPNDLVRYENRIYRVRGTQNGGKYVRLHDLKKVPRVDQLIPYQFSKGIVWC